MSGRHWNRYNSGAADGTRQTSSYYSIKRENVTEEEKSELRHHDYNAIHHDPWDDIIGGPDKYADMNPVFRGWSWGAELRGMGISDLGEVDEGKYPGVTGGKGILLGENHRVMLPCRVRLISMAEELTTDVRSKEEKQEKAKWVYFMLNTASPRTYLSKQASEVFGIKPGGAATVEIEGLEQGVLRAPEGVHWEDDNVLGMDFMWKHKVQVKMDYEARDTVELVFEGK